VEITVATALVAVNVLKPATASNDKTARSSGTAELEALTEHTERVRSLRRAGQAEEAGAKETATAARSLSDLLEV
jgi:hypothetical protein